MDDQAPPHSFGASTEFVRFGVSEEFRSLIEGVRQSPGITGDKFRRKDVDTVARALLCRSYHTLCLRLSYLLTAVANGYSSADPILHFFWVNEAISPSRVRKAFEKPRRSDLLNIRILDTSLHLEFTCADTQQSSHFSLSLNGIKELAVLFEVLVQIKPEILFETLYEARESTIKKTASRFQSILYEYLSIHTQSKHDLERFRKIWAWLNENLVSPDAALNDQTIFDFWQSTADTPDSTLGFRRFRSVVDDFFALNDSLRTLRTADNLSHHLSIGHEESEVDPDKLYHALEHASDETPDYRQLTTNPKFVVAKRLTSIQPLLMLGKDAVKLPLTCLRYSILGDWQAQLIQAHRDSADQRLTQAISDGPQESYATRIDALNQLLPDFEVSKLCGLYVLFESGCSSALALIAHYLSPESLQALQQHAIDNFNLCASEIDELNLDDVNADLMGLRLKIPEINILIQRAQKAFKQNNRLGFTSIPPALPLEAYEEGIDLLDKLMSSTRTLVLNMSAEAEKYDADVSIARRMMRTIYGGSE